MTGTDRDRDRDGDREEGGSFLARWSERKRAVREGEAPPDDPAPPAAPEPAKAEEDPEVLAANRAAAEAVDLDKIGPGFDLSLFHKAGVPAALRMAALQKYWRSHPIISARDLLCDYIEDFNDPARIMKAPLTSWKPGRGWLTANKADAAKPKAVRPPSPAEQAQEPRAEEAAPAEAAPEQEEAAPVADAGRPEADEEPAPRVPLRARLDLAAFKEEKG